MEFVDILTKDQILTDLKAANRWEAIDELIGNLVSTGKIKPENRDAITAVVKKRETSMSTGIGFGIGIPHASTELIPEVVGALGRSKKGINFDALDNQPVSIVMLFLVPQGQFQKHLHTLANIAKLLHKADFRSALEQAPDAESMMKVVAEFGKKIIPAVWVQAANRWDAIDELIKHLVDTGKIKAEHRESITTAVKNRESLISTGIGYGIGIPHAMTDHVPDLVVVLGRSRTGIEFEALDHKPVKIIILFLVPRGQFQRHLEVLADIARLVQDPDFRKKLEQAQDVDAILSTVKLFQRPSILPHKLIEQRLQEAVRVVVPDADTAIVLVRPCPDPKFGDYQTSALMALAKPRKLNPRQLATDVLAKLDVSPWCEKVEIAGAGFLNFKLKPEAFTATLESAARGEHLFFEKTAQPRTVVVDFSSPNVAKPMHVGHIRSTALGDSLARTLRLLGHHVVTDNHIGDWGTQFGMLLVGWKTLLDQAALEREPLVELERIYKIISPQCDPEKPVYNQAVQESARNELVKLQQGDAENLGIWREMIRLSQAQFDAIYGRLGVKFDHALGESFYNPRLQAVVDDLTAKGIARESEGAKCVFSDGTLPPKEDPFLIQRDGEWHPNPELIQKRDGGFNYATTDLATIAYRLETWHPNGIVYVTDGRQQLHFQQVFATFRRWHPELAGKVNLSHVWFGSILGDDGKPLKTRSGENVKLADVLDEAEERAFKVVSEKNTELTESQRREVARVIGIGAVKYADLLPNRQSDYVFSWDKMLALSGNTAVYLLYAYARIQSILRKGGLSEPGTRNSPLSLAAPQEVALARQLLNFGIVLEAVADEYRPNYLCNYLYELAGSFTSFYENCPVLKAEDENTRHSRLTLCELTARVLKQGLEVLGIESVEQM